MHTKTRNNMQEIDSPPLPPAPVFNEEQMAAAQPVQPLPDRRWRRSTDIFPHIIGRRITAIAAIAASSVICVAIAAASVDWQAAPPSAEDNPAQSMSESIAPPTAPQPSTEATVKKQDHKRRSLSSRRVRETLPPLEFDEGYDDPKPKARLVSVIH